LARDIADQISEHSGKRFKELAEEVGLSTDEEYNLSVDNDKTTKMKRGEF
jgi:hypothetical protein